MTACIPQNQTILPRERLDLPSPDAGVAAQSTRQHEGEPATVALIVEMDAVDLYAWHGGTPAHRLAAPRLYLSRGRSAHGLWLDPFQSTSHDHTGSGGSDPAGVSHARAPPLNDGLVAVRVTCTAHRV
jgi:hypothetical protein